MVRVAESMPRHVASKTVLLLKPKPFLAMAAALVALMSNLPHAMARYQLVFYIITDNGTSTCLVIHSLFGMCQSCRENLSVLEYASVIWSPYTLKVVHQVQSVQSNFTV